MRAKGEKTENGWHSLVRALRLPETALTTTTQIELVGQHEMNIENARGILEYDDHFIKLFLGEKSLIIEGRGLRIDLFLEKTIIVRGHIETVSFV